ncbi:hypothetical protein AGABI1DRAFT_113519 [Agaricus bisporus var. burnettii JB137-S8]|uniref:Uncharacterized protein n=2 Tax=Agaricus bisporus var. burnettii TaxID=192524 RepID=K5WXT2_AGABU|nr:uncharacterized protein AGABI1DRAFT_113519 [Agaricus bisporus var. burnettii JB137-S8]EKM80321.1 hypothetical protein AGABI1DRAFT_113519 [Agaricus bisporus var. burnettii JB137-S8]KAF7776192.1 hypothetical protein Agabi119p4_4585 [Agaricus bisporus var. burnettii]
MSATTTPGESPLGTPIQPLHNPSQAAQVVVPQAPLGNANLAYQAPGMGAKALLAKKFAKTHNPNFVSPTDNLMTPVSQKLNAAKKKQFSKGAKPVQLFTQKENIESNSVNDSNDDDEMSDASKDEPVTQDQPQEMKIDDENPF